MKGGQREEVSTKCVFFFSQANNNDKCLSDSLSAVPSKVPADNE